MRSKQSAYTPALLDPEHPKARFTRLRGLPDCIAILSPDFPASAQRLEPQVEWVARVFGDRTWAALTLHARAMDDGSDSGYVAHLKRFFLNNFGLPWRADFGALVLCQFATVGTVLA